MIYVHVGKRFRSTPLSVDVRIWSSPDILSLHQCKMIHGSTIKNKTGLFVKHECPQGQQSPKLAIISLKVTRSLTLVPFERVSLVKYACKI